MSLRFVHEQREGRRQLCPRITSKTMVDMSGRKTRAFVAFLVREKVLAVEAVQVRKRRRNGCNDRQEYKTQKKKYQSNKVKTLRACSFSGQSIRKEGRKHCYRLY